MDDSLLNTYDTLTYLTGLFIGSMLFAVFYFTLRAIKPAAKFKLYWATSAALIVLALGFLVLKMLS